MKDERIIIRKRSKNFLIEGFIYLVLIIASLVVALIPFISPDIKTKTPFYLIGGIALAVFAALFIRLLIAQSKPSEALILEKRGFTDLMNIGQGITVDWTNVSSAKLLGKDGNATISVTLENSDIVISKMKHSPAQALRKNIEEGEPAISWKQSDIMMPITELKSLIDDYMRDSRQVVTEQKKGKNNPFSSDDVLRAFGQFPSQVKEEKNESVASEISDIKAESSARRKKEAPKDDFFEALKEVAISKKAEAKTERPPVEPVGIIKDIPKDIPAETAPEASDKTITFSKETDSVKNRPIEPIEDEYMPEEIRKILSEAHSEKISELGKMLSEKGLPYSYEKNSKPQTDDKIEIKNDSAAEEIVKPKEQSDSDLSIMFKKDPDIESITPIIKDETPFIIRNSSDEYDRPEILESFGIPDADSDVIITNIIDNADYESASKGDAQSFEFIAEETAHEASKDEEEYPELVMIDNTDDNAQTPVSDEEEDQGFIFIED